MKQRMIYSSCPYCGHDFQILRDTYEIADMNSIVEERLQNETYFIHQCNRCKELYYLQYPFMYRNPKLKYMIVLSQKGDLSDLPKNEKVIRVKNSKQFPFVYKVLKNNLDLKQVIKIQKTLEQKYQKKIVFDSYREQKLWFIVEKDYIAVTYKEK